MLFARGFGGRQWAPEEAASASRGTTALLVAGTAVGAAATAAATFAARGGRSESVSVSLARTAGRGLIS